MEGKLGAAEKKISTPMKGKDAYQKIRTLLAELDDEEKEIALKNMEDEGF